MLFMRGEGAKKGPKQSIEKKKQECEEVMARETEPETDEEFTEVKSRKRSSKNSPLNEVKHQKEYRRMEDIK